MCEDLFNMGSPPVKVYVWDLDETLILYQALWDGSFQTRIPNWPNISDAHPDAYVRLGNVLYDVVVKFCEEHLDFSSVLDCTISHVSDICTPYLSHQHKDAFHSLLKVYEKLRKRLMENSQQTVVDAIGDVQHPLKDEIELAYNRQCPPSVASTGSVVDGGVVDSQQSTVRLMPQLDVNMLWKDYLSYTEKWINVAREVLHLSQGTSAVTAGVSGIGGGDGGNNLAVVHYLVTNSHLVACLSKLLFFQLASYFPLENIYSAAVITKADCFHMINSKLQLDYPGQRLSVLVIGDSLEEEMAGRELNWPVWRVQKVSDLKALKLAVTEYL